MKVSNEAFVDAIFHGLPADRTYSVANSPISIETIERFEYPAFALPRNEHNFLSFTSYPVDNVDLLDGSDDTGLLIHAIELYLKLASENDPEPGLTDISWVLEYEPGMFCGGFILEQPISPAEARALYGEMRDKNIAHHASGVVFDDVFWMPVGINGGFIKDGKRFRIKAHHWQPEARFTVDQIRASLRLESLSVVET